MKCELLDRALSEFQEAYPGADIEQRDDEGASIEMEYLLDAEFAGVRLVEKYALLIEVAPTFPCAIPIVTEKSDNIPKNYEHMFEDHSFCLGARFELLVKLKDDPSLVKFLEGPIRSYLYSALYRERYGCYPYGDRSHGLMGIMEAYMDHFDVRDMAVALKIMGYIAEGNYRGHLECPCGSGYRVRDCHGPMMLEVMSGQLRDTVVDDLDSIRKCLLDGSAKKDVIAKSVRLQIPGYCPSR